MFGFVVKCKSKMLLNWCLLVGLVLSEVGLVPATKYGNNSKVNSHEAVKPFLILLVHFSQRYVSLICEVDVDVDVDENTSAGV